MKHLRNTSDKAVHGLYNGIDFDFAPGQIMVVDDAAGVHLLQTRHAQLIEVDPRNIVITEKAEEPAAPAEGAWDPIAQQQLAKGKCEVCGKDFSDKEDPEYSLKQHKSRAHKPEGEPANATA